MEINSNYQVYNYKNQYQPSFSSAKDITLNYLVKKRAYSLPSRILTRAKELVSSMTSQTSLLDLHKQTYAPLLSCKTLDEARNLFPEFREILDAKILLQKRSKHTEKIFEKVKPEDLSLKLLQKYWANLSSQEEIAKEFGVSRYAVQWINEKLNFPAFPKNYLTLLKASDEKLNAQIAQKTTDFNLANPEQMYARNRHAAQFCKTKKYKRAQSTRIKEYDKAHPERKQKIADFDREVWERLPQIRAALREELKTYKKIYSIIAKKESQHQPLNEFEERMKKSFYKKFWTKYPEYKAQYSEMRKIVSEERKAGKNLTV